MNTKDAKFDRIFYASFAILIILCLGLLLLNINQGPRMRRVQLDPRLTTQQSNQRIIIYANKQIAKLSEEQVKISPEVKYSLVNNGEAIILQLKERLSYDTTYHITVSNVYSPSQSNKKATFFHSFKTAIPNIYYIKRNFGISGGQLAETKKPDQIVRTSMAGGEESIYSAEKIQDFVISGDKLVVSTLNADNSNSLYLVDLKSNKAEQLDLPGKGSVYRLGASSNGRQIGFIYSSNESEKNPVENVLYEIDLLAGRLYSPVIGLNSKPIEVVEWTYAPDGTTILAQTFDSSLYLIDTNLKNDPAPLGRFYGFINFSHNGDAISVSSSKGPLIINSLTRERSAPKLEPINGVSTTNPVFYLLSNGPGYIAVSDYFANDSAGKSFVTMAKSKKQKTIAVVDQSQYFIVNYTLSPNDQYLAMEVSRSGDDSRSEYLDNNKSKSTVTWIIGAGDGKRVREIEGINLKWK